MRAWFRRVVLRRSVVTSCSPHGLAAGDVLRLAGSIDSDGVHVVTRSLSPFDFEIRRQRRRWLSDTVRYILKMFAAFALSLFLIVKSSHLAADGKTVSACLLGFIVFALFFFMASESVKAEREAGK